MATWTPPADAVETTEGWIPPADAVEVQPSPMVAPVQRTAPVVQPPKPGYKPTVFEEVTGAVTEPLLKMGTGLIAKPVSEVAGIAAMFSDYLGGKRDGDPMGFRKHVQESLTYQPRTIAGRSEYNPINAIPEAVGKGVSAITTPVMGVLRGDAAADSARGIAVNALGEAVPQALGVVGVKNAPLIAKRVAKAGPVVGEVAADVAKNASFTKQAAARAASSADWQRAAAIDAAKKAKTHGILIDASVSNPTLSNRLTGTVAGGSTKVGEGMAKANANRWGNAYKRSVGLDIEQPLNLATYEALRTKMAAPYREVAKMGDMVADEGIVKSLKSISVPDVIAKEAAAPKMARIVDAAVAKAERGMNGAQILEEIKTLRKTGNSLKSKSADPISLAEGKAYLEVAKVFEDMLDKNLVSNPKLLGQVRKARTDIAQSYVAQNATNLTTHRLDPTVLAKQMADGEKLTGTLADLGDIAGNYPHIAKVDPTVWDTAKMHLSRAGVGGSLGFAAGSMVGAPFVGAVIGGGVSEVVGKMVNNKMRSAGYQAKNATPIDRRIMPVETPKAAPQRGVVPYVSPTELVDDMPYRPNFTRGRVDPNPTYTGPDYQQPQIGLSTEPVGGQMGALRAEDARVRETSMRQGRAAEAAQAAAEAAAPRKPTSGGMLFDLDPVTGKLRAADRGVKGATPEIWQADTGASLRSAADKAASGQNFKMSAAEKVAWNKTAVDIQSSLPELGKLSDKQIMSKMQDRQWVQSTIDKANQKADMFAQLERQSQDRMSQSLARIQREKLMDVVEQLQDTLGSRPSSRGYGQGPKTRAFQRGMLTGTEQ